MNDSLLLVGRGPSVYGYDWSGDLPIMAISSGAFAVPEEHAHRIDHFVTLDVPKFYFEPIHDDGEDGICWAGDDKCRHWPFWLDTSIMTHTTKHRLQPMKYKTIPPEVVDVIPDHLLPAFTREMIKAHHAMGFQPTWADYPPHRAWPLMSSDGVNFEPEGPIGLDGICNSLFFGIQIAHRLGFKRLEFIGVDMNGSDHYQPQRELMAKWWKLAQGYGYEWVNLGEGSSLCEILPSVETIGV